MDEAGTTTTQATERYLIVNADDLGASAGINRGVMEAHDAGPITSASLMVDMPGAPEAARLAAGRPGLSVGLHADLTGEGRTVDVDLDDAAACGREVRAQLARFEDLLQRSPSHLDGHHNIQRRPNLEPVFAEIAAERDLPLREHSQVRYLPDFYGQWDDGLTHLEWISARNLVDIIERCVRPGVTELACHPGYVDPRLTSSYHAEREAELRALLDPLVARHLEAADLHLVNYDDLRHGLGAAT